MAAAKQVRPRSKCAACEHSSQWHGQNELSMKNGASSYPGASCFFPGCSCKTYAPTLIRPAS